MRPHSEVRAALLSAASTLATPQQAPTLRELAAHAQVGHDHARRMVNNLTRYGALTVVRTRRVQYRNRPVAEYAPVQAHSVAGSGSDAGFVDLGQMLRMWSGATAAN